METDIQQFDTTKSKGYPMLFKVNVKNDIGIITAAFDPGKQPVVNDKILLYVKTYSYQSLIYNFKIIEILETRTARGNHKIKAVTKTLKVKLIQNDNE